MNLFFISQNCKFLIAYKKTCFIGRNGNISQQIFIKFCLYTTNLLDLQQMVSLKGI